MATLSRVTGKVFGGNAPLDEIGQFGSAKSGTPLNTQDVATIQALPAYTNGWGSAIMTSRNFPPIEEVTGVLKTISYQNCYLLQEGVPTYDVGTNYSATSIVKVINGTNLSFYVSLVDNNLGNSLSDGTKWAKASFADRAIGEIVTSAIPLSDSGLHLLDGSVLSGSGIYAQFVSYIADIYNSGLNYFCSEADWQQSITDYGVCGKFVYTPASGNNPATVRLPKVTGFIEGTLDNTKLGDLVEAGLPNITGGFCADNTQVGNTQEGDSIPPFGVFYKERNLQKYDLRSQTDQGPGGVMGFDASRSSSVYGNSNTVQPQTVKVLYYIVVATTTKTSIEVDIDEIATDLNGKADVDLSNCTKPHIVEVSSSSILPRWYRVYSDGWCEQGGSATRSSAGTTSVSFSKNFSSTNYTVIVSSDTTLSGHTNNITSKTTADFSCYWNGNLDWRADGFIN